jgi:predicted GNAT superfamily acetyltransferase
MCGLVPQKAGRARTFFLAMPMNDLELQPITAGEVAAPAPLGAAMLALNNAHAQELSWLEPARLERLVTHAFLARRIGNLDAFLLAFDQDAPYDSPNFLWFRNRYPRFAYIDRIAVAASARGRGLARLLYRGLFDEANRRGHEHVACEVNLAPPNPASDAFHAALGFVEVGRASIHNGSKIVRYLKRPLELTGAR